MKKNPGQKEKVIRHSLAHILASAVLGLYPGTKFGMGPAVENGFYYDFDIPEGKTLNENDLPKIEKKMKEIIKKGIEFKKKSISKTKAKKIFKGQPYKLELIEELPGENVSIYESEKFRDLCRGPHVKSTKEIPLDAFGLTRLAGAYWKGSERNPMLTRIYGIAFKNKKEMEEYLSKEKEAEKRDHRLLGQMLEIFMIDEGVGAGLPLWLPKGATLRHIIENYLYEELKSQGYSWIITPHIAKLGLWKTSGHWNFYKENLYSPIKIEKEEYLLKPMNCPFHVKVYNSKIRSYKDLPFYLAELGTVYRYERSGVLHGLTRVRGFTQDDAHVICAPEQIANEINKLVKQALKMLKTFGFKEFYIYLSTRPEKYTGSPKDWEKSTNTLKYVLGKLKLKYETDEGGGSFYGPKIDIKIKDSLQREWQCTTIQFDFNLPERFDMNYIDQKGKKKKPYMIHRALLGSMERFVGVLLEYYGGAFPLWLSPVQAWVIPISSRHIKYAEKIGKELDDNGLRFEIKDGNETVSKKIREGEIQKVPYLLVVGDKEMKEKAVRVRERGKGDTGLVKFTKFSEKVKIRLRQKK